MGDSNKTPGVFNRIFTRRQPPGPDAADLGTCMGLEFSMDQAATAAPAPAAPRQAPRWMKKITTRAATGR